MPAYIILMSWNEFRIPPLTTADGGIIHPEFWLGSAVGLDKSPDHDRST